MSALKLPTCPQVFNNASFIPHVIISQVYGCHSHPRKKSKKKHWENIFYCKRSEMKSLSTLKPLCMCWPLLLMPMAQGSYGLCSNNEKGRKNIIWGKRGDVGQGRLLNESHMLHSWHSHSYKHLLHPCPCCQCHLERGTMGIVRRTFWSAQGKLRTGSSCSSSTNSLEVCVL